MTMPFHPLADLFPLIEGAEFDELVTSIKENGQRVPIILLDGSILDGRNRYRACEAAGAKPVFDTITTADPIKYVLDANVRRRHLNESQRAMIAAKIATLEPGNVMAQRAEQYKEKDGAAMATPSLSLEQAADLLGVHRASVSHAKTVLKSGTPEEIKAVREGKAAVTTISRDIRKKKPAAARKSRRELPPSLRGKNPERIENLRIKAQIWSQVRDALAALSSLPLPTDAVAIVSAHDKAGFVDSRLTKSLQWLMEFSDAWRARDQAAA